MAREQEGIKAHLMDGLDGTRDGWRELVGDGVELGGGDERRLWCSGKGMARRGGGKASRAQCGASWRVMWVGGGLWQRVHSGQGLPELGEGAVVRYAGDGVRPGLFIGPEWRR